PLQPKHGRRNTTPNTAPPLPCLTACNANGFSTSVFLRSPPISLTDHLWPCSLAFGILSAGFRLVSTCNSGGFSASVLRDPL
ncbi:hypothetical protein U1Q18_043558, partial [Sarracenia purpurea var. burkii]